MVALSWVVKAGSGGMKPRAMGDQFPVLKDSATRFTTSRIHEYIFPFIS